MQQLVLELAAPPAPAFDNFFSARNTHVLAALQRLADSAAQGPEGDRFFYLWGPRGSGKSHLLRALVDTVNASRSAETAQPTGPLHAARYVARSESIDSGDGDACIAVDDVDHLDMVGQLALFDLYNRVRTGNGLLVTAGDRPPVELPLREDLRTRLGAGVVMRLEPLNDEEKAAAISEHARTLGIALAPELIDYLLTHVARDMGTQRAVIDTLDRLSLERKRAPTLPLLREVLQRLAQQRDGRR